MGYGTAQIAFEVLGDFSIRKGGERLVLPASRKTRALLAYLAVTGRPQRRERLCELFWDVPDDPKGALRWSLSKLRSALGDADKAILDANRSTVHLAPGSFALDSADLLAAKMQGFDLLPTERLETLAQSLRGGFLEDLSMPNCPGFEAWRVALADEFGQMARRLLLVLIARLDKDPDRARAYSNALRLLSAEIGTGGLDLPNLSPLRPFVAPPPEKSARLSFDVRYCLGRDGTRLAYASGGQGPLLVRAPHWLSHLHYDAETPIWRHWMAALHDRFTCLRYDERGNGLSDWSATDLSFEAMVDDLDIVVEAAGVSDFTLLGISQGAAIAVAYAVRRPEKVKRLILFGGFAKGVRKRGNAQDIALRDAIEVLLREGWGSDNPIFRNMFVHRFVPKATTEHMVAMAELQRRTVSAENALALSQMASMIDVTELLPQVTVPTLVVHCREDRVAPVEAGQALAAGIPGARFLLLDSDNHILLHDEPAFAELMQAVDAFCRDDG